MLEVVWDKDSVQTPGVFISYKELMTPRWLTIAITELARYGLVFIEGVPTYRTSNEECELKKLAEAFGEIRPTFYGLLWDVVNQKDSKNIAYTNLDLGHHMDLM
jgi:hypothetical protein